ncbi:basic leucine zipper 19-like [Papaver somniferum]|uniref:basic leucine zipper 19-like n=1 Tax=Papaver somniferum TaxID=3469 RepID=UPI000E6FB1BC|nr:basic leucine zipper 19-like [Papaver somniferum]
MDDGEFDFSNQVLKNMEHQLTSSCAMDSCFFNDILDHTHGSNHTNSTSNQTEQGMPELPHSQNYINFSTKNLPAAEKNTTEGTDESDDNKPKKRQHGNRESVRKYRERKKARQASIEDELNRMRIVNQQLLKRMQGLVSLEQEVARFKCLLVDIRGRIKGELGSFPYKTPTNGIGVIPQKMPLPPTSAGACEVNHCDHQCPESLEFGKANVRLKTNFSTSTAAKKRKGKTLNRCLNHV